MPTRSAAGVSRGRRKCCLLVSSMIVSAQGRFPPITYFRDLRWRPHCLDMRCLQDLLEATVDCNCMNATASSTDEVSSLGYAM